MVPADTLGKSWQDKPPFWSAWEGKSRGEQLPRGLPVTLSESLHLLRCGASMVLCIILKGSPLFFDPPPLPTTSFLHAVALRGRRRIGTLAGLPGNPSMTSQRTAAARLPRPPEEGRRFSGETETGAERASTGPRGSEGGSAVALEDKEFATVSTRAVK